MQQSHDEAIPFSCLQSDPVSARAQRRTPKTVSMGGQLLKLARARKEKLVKPYSWSTRNLNR